MLIRLLKKLCPATKRLCPLVSLALAFGCGKKISDEQSGSGGKTLDADTPSTVQIMELDDDVAPTAKYKFPKSGWSMVPEKLMVKAGDGTGRRVKISFGVKVDGDYTMHCYYQSTIDPYELPLEVCKSKNESHSYGSNVETIGPTPIEKGQEIKMEFLNSTGDDNIISAVFIVSWV